MKLIDTLFKEIEQELELKSHSIKTEDTGIVKTVKDEVVTISGLSSSAYGEVVTFDTDISGMIVELAEDEVSVIVFGDYTKIKEGDRAVATGKILSIPVSDMYIGRVVDALGNPIDGAGNIKTEVAYPVERIAPGVLMRKSVDTPLQTGIKAIDTLVPVGRGQRQLIIGDRGVGKSTVALDTILNQKDQDVICIYVTIGQRKAKIVAAFELLKKHGSMDHTIIVSASASESASCQFIVPYSACALGEYFMEKGKDVLIIYDDLTKHAWAYRQISLALRRPSGREAYPGDIFYLHSRLLERACRLNKKYGGGSLTALPLIETQEGDVSAYIPTNVISITDGQIFLEADLFNSGIRPAINVGISVSRVGSAAQTKAIKQVAGKLKLDLAQYRELAAFSQFESELDTKTKQFIERGNRMTQLLKQDKHSLLSLEQQTVIFFAASKGYFDSIPVNDIVAAEAKLLLYVEQHAGKLLAQIKEKKMIEKTVDEELDRVISQFVSYYESATGEKKD